MGKSPVSSSRRTPRKPVVMTRSRRIVLIVLLALVIAGMLVTSLTPWGETLRHHPAGAAQIVKSWVTRHHLLSPWLLLGIYCGLMVLMLPVWPIQVLAGVGFGFTQGSILCILSATIASLIGWSISRWLAGDWIRHRLESRQGKLFSITRAMEHNGLLVVLCVRAMHVLPFGLSNYFFGLSGIRAAQVLMGTIVGGAPSILFYVALGDDPHWLTLPSFWIALALIELCVLTPVMVRWHRHRKRLADHPPV